MFASQAARLMEAARLLGHGPWSAFRHVALPLARPAIAVGLCLVLLETLNDIGASEFLGLQTLTVAIYTTWVTRSDLAGAAQIALVALALVTVLIAVERHGRRRLRYTGNRRAAPIHPHRLRGTAAGLATLLGLAPILIGFVAPAAYLLTLTLERLGAGQGPTTRPAAGRRADADGVGPGHGRRPGHWPGGRLEPPHPASGPRLATRPAPAGDTGLCRTRHGPGHRPALPR